MGESKFLKRSTSMPWKNPGYLASQSEFGRTMGWSSLTFKVQEI